MRIIRFVLVALFMGVVATAPVQAAAPLEAAQAVQAQLGAGKTLTNGEAADIIAAFESAAAAHPDMLSEMAALVAAARPDLGAQLKASIIKLNPDNADSIIEQMEQAANDPTADQLSALAAIEGREPSSGHDDSGSGEKDGSDLGWANYTVDRDGSPD